MSYGTIKIGRISDASSNAWALNSWDGAKTIQYTKYNIKETDFRVKTATFTSPQFLDLTTGQFAILISSDYHENFAGIVLDVSYDENTGLYSYQCQDWSRRYISKLEAVVNNVKLYNLLRYLISRGGVPSKNPTSAQKEKYQKILKGLRALGKYDQSLYEGNIYGSNFFNQSISLIIRDKSYIEVIRSLVHNSLGYYDVYFNDLGVLQIEPISKTDWENTGLILNNGEYYNRQFKFSTTNAITNVHINGSDLKTGSNISSTDVTDLNLSAFFGNVSTSISNPNNNNTSNAVKSSSKTSTSSSKSTKSTNNNPYNRKSLKAWINSDNGSNSMKNALANGLKKKGWKVHVGATDSNAHYRDYWNVTKDYSVYITLYNGFCAGTIREAYSSKIQNELKKKGVQLVPIWDSSDWTNPKGMKPYRYGDFSKYSASRAWDDNFSKSNPSIKNVGDYLKKNKATYCVSPTATEIIKQFLAGGYFKSKGIKV